MKYEKHTYTIVNIYQKELDMVTCANVCAKNDEDGNVFDKNELCKMYTFLFRKLFQLVVDNNKQN